MTESIVLRTEQNGVEFYTVQETGESGINQTGLAKLCGVAQSTISKLEASFIPNTPPECLKAFVGKDFCLFQNAAIIDGHLVGNLTIYKAEFCVAVMEYFAFEKNKKEAMFSYRKFASMGINTWIQSITQWKPVEKVLTPTEALLLQVQRMVEVEREIAAMKEEVKIHDLILADHHQKLNEQHHELTGVKAEVHRYSNGTGDFYSILAWSRILKMNDLTLPQSQKLGRKASKICKGYGIIPVETRDPRFGFVKTYPEYVLEQVDFRSVA